MNAVSTTAVEVAQQARPPKKQSRYTYTDGPMFYLGQQIVKAMQDVGWDATISECYRTPERQEQLIAKGVSQARQWASAHQYWCAVDIIHKTKGWNVPPRFWEDLAAVTKMVAEKFDVELEHGHNWSFVDSAHIELKDFRYYRGRYHGRDLTVADLSEMFEEVLPKVWKQYTRSVGYRA